MKKIIGIDILVLCLIISFFIKLSYGVEIAWSYVFVPLICIVALLLPVNIINFLIKYIRRKKNTGYSG